MSDSCNSMDYSLPGSLSMEFSRQEDWSGLPFPTPGDLSDPEIEPMSLVAPALAGGYFTTAPSGKPILAIRPQLTTTEKYILLLEHITASNEIRIMLLSKKWRWTMYRKLAGSTAPLYLVPSFNKRHLLRST